LIAIRSNLWVTCLAILMIAIQGLAGAYLKIGYFRDEIEVSQLDNYWTYMLIISLIGITISSYLNELKTARNEAINRKEEFRSLFSNMTNGFALHKVIRDASGKMVNYRFIDVNPAFEKMTGLSRSLWIGNTVKEVIPETENYWIEHYEKVVDTGEVGVYENFSKPLGRWYSTYAYSPAPECFAVIIQDITLQRERPSPSFMASNSVGSLRWKVLETVFGTGTFKLMKYSFLNNGKRCSAMPMMKSIITWKPGKAGFILMICLKYLMIWNAISMAKPKLISMNTGCVAKMAAINGFWTEA
jgi:PAS domain S-box-containing protein